MKQKTGLFALLAIAVTALLFVISGKRAYERGIDTETSGIVPSSPSPTYTASSLSLKKIISTPIRHESTAMARTSPACSRFEDAIFGLTLTDLDYPPKMNRVPNPAGCSPENVKLAKLKTYYEKSCASAMNALPDPEIPEEKWNKDFSECRLAIMMLRSSLAALARGDRPLNEIQDLRELADLLVSNFALFFSGDMNVEVAGDVRKIADRMAEVEPHLVPAVKAGAMGAMLENMMKISTEKENPPDWTDLDQRISELRNLSPDDPDLDTLLRISGTEGMNPDLVVRDSTSRLAKNPNSWREHQILAWAKFRQGRREEAATALRNARALSPSNRELDENWVVIHRPNSVPDDFKVSLKVGVDFTELLK